MNLYCHISTIQCENPERTYEPIPYVRDYFLHIECRLQRKKNYQGNLKRGNGEFETSLWFS